MSKKEKIEGNLRRAVWEKWASPGSGIVNCYACYRLISVFDFICGHVIPESRGGPTTVGNLRPICNKCNLLMATIDLNEYKAKMDACGVTQTNRELNPIVQVNTHVRNVETRVIDSSLELLSEAELKDICKFYEVGVTGNKKKLADNIKSSPKYDPSTFQNINKMRKVLMTVRPEMLIEICRDMNVSELKEGTSEPEMIRLILNADPNFNYTKYCCESQRDNKKRTNMMENKINLSLSISNFAMKYIPFSENDNKKAILIAGKNDDRWITTILPTSLGWHTIETFDEDIKSYLSFNDEKKNKCFFFDGSSIKIVIDTDNPSMCIMLILEREPIVEHKNVDNPTREYNQLPIIDLISLPIPAINPKCLCPDCDARISKLELAFAEFTKKKLIN